MGRFPAAALIFLLALRAAPGARSAEPGSGTPEPVAAAAVCLITPDMERRMHAAVDAIYRMDYADAQAQLDALGRLNPEHPAHDFGLAGLVWVRYLYESEQTDSALIGELERRLEGALEKSEAWLKLHPGDAETILLIGASQGLMGRLRMSRGQWVRAYFSGRSGMKHVRRAVNLDPGLYDAYLGLGAYDYFTDTYSRLVRILAKLVLRGSRERGIKSLKLAASKGRYMTTTAKLLLVEIYLTDRFGARDPAGALELMREIRERYPKSSLMHWALLSAQYEDKRYAEVIEGAQDFLRRVASGEYRQSDRAKGNVTLGTAYYAFGRYEESLAAFRSASAVTLAGRPSRWAVWAMIRSGQVLDILGRRKEALECYREAKRQPDHWGFRKAIGRGLARPFTKDDPKFTAWPLPEY